MGHKIIKSYESELSLHVGILAEMSSGVAKGNSLMLSSGSKPKKNHTPVFGSKTFLNTEDVSKTRETGFQVQLRGLSEESCLAVII